MYPHRKYNLINKTMIENKHIQVSDNSYRLTIIKNGHGYTAHLSDVDSQYTNEKLFSKNELNPATLENWIVESDNMNNPETRFFENLKQWDGVVR